MTNAENPIHVGVLVIATNRYLEYAIELIKSCRQHFLPDADKTFFLFTNLIGERGQDPAAEWIEIEHAPWPAMTLHRYQIFSNHSSRLATQDYLYYLDADMRVVSTVGREVIGELVATLHPNWYLITNRRNLPYERNPDSTAFVPPYLGGHYYAGGFNGGSASAFLSMSESLAANIAEDERRGIVAIWHDESHLNNYLRQHAPTVRLSASYCYPEEMSREQLPLDRKILALAKVHKRMRREPRRRR